MNAPELLPPWPAGRGLSIHDSQARALAIATEALAVERKFG